MYSIYVEDDFIIIVGENSSDRTDLSIGNVSNIVRVQRFHCCINPTRALHDNIFPGSTFHRYKKAQMSTPGIKQRPPDYKVKHQC